MASNLSSYPHGKPIFTPQVTQNLWPSSGYELLVVDANGHLLVTDAYLRHLLFRPEIAPIAESCTNEIALHHVLDAEPSFGSKIHSTRGR